jgi:predicted DNA-binding transcriptional regulator YafY
MDKAERLLRLLGLLEGRIDWTAEELGNRLGVTTRTIRRDIGRLRELGYPVEALAGPGGGYRLGAGAKLPPLLLDDEEALVVALGLRLATSAAVDGLEDASLSALAKLENVLPPKLRSRLSDISSATVSSPGRRGDAVGHEELAVTAAAANNGQRIRFSYTDAEGRNSARHVEPLHLVHTGRRWYLVAFDLDRDDWRTFRLDRVDKPKATGFRSAKRASPDPVEMVRRGITIEAWNFRAEVHLSVSADHARRVIPDYVGTLEEIDEHNSTLLIGADEPTWLARYLVGLPFDFRLEGSPELARELAAIGRQLVSRYG